MNTGRDSLISSSHRSPLDNLAIRGANDGLASTISSGSIIVNTPWYKKLYYWLIVFDGDNDIIDGKTYNYLPSITNYVYFIGGRVKFLYKPNDKLNLLYPSLVLFILVSPMVLFSIFEANTLWNTKFGYKGFVFFFYYFWCMSLSFFVRAMTSDPGILPKNIHIPKLANNFQLPQEYYNLIRLPIKDESQYVEITYCRTCRIWRPPRSSHCSICDCCVMSLDHHCLWLNNCVGKRNYRYFLIFLTSTIMTVIFLLINTGIHIGKNRHEKKPASNIPVTILLTVYGSLSISYPIILLAYHLVLTGTNQTTREFLKYVYEIRDQHRKSKNPVFMKIIKNKNNIYDKHNAFKNILSLFCQSRGISLQPARKTVKNQKYASHNIDDGLQMVNPQNNELRYTNLKYDNLQ
ncbi:hypothetical protein TPHA_0C02360 [Tetrapisispora phaffii CBS 4417]|uniref:Palmitoyltransferase n=1 Tax=Tetrapisispora phaffii (strain ATCC 24235 / CBS 4417 / NBRC 1672 / NRRL Y-8282 / UCD 70-5) TaxID=1071381 RepID=G8BRL3_TETPH|nr:hypothetical protein TPHA_0C02360 [Tetrapisispora phaffii CBS 4417]CCE62389.1 hypothetical protein TPHA_0C02360 [Tetrapisispora phaffii CBS 4417]